MFKHILLTYLMLFSRRLCGIATELSDIMLNSNINVKFLFSEIYLNRKSQGRSYLDFSLKEYMNDVTQKLIQKNVSVNINMTNLQDNIQEIDNHYNEYRKNIGRNYSHYEKKVIEYSNNLLNETMGLPAKISDIITDLFGRKTDSLVKIIQANIEVLEPQCFIQQSRQQYFYELQLRILSTVFKAYTTMEYALNVTHVDGDENSQLWLDGETKEKLIDIYLSFEEILKNASREIWNCDVLQNKNSSYTQLKNVFEIIFYNVLDFYSSPRSTCPTQCPQLNTALTPKCHSTNKCMLKQRICENVVLCRGIDKLYSQKFEICLLKNQTESRYSYAKKVRENETSQKHCDGEVRILDGENRKGSCKYCECVCEETKSSDRYFSLESVMSDIKNNYVVTGVQFVKKNHTVYIEVQEGKLLPGGFVNNSSVRWKSADLIDKHDQINKVYNKKLFILNYKTSRPIFLDDIELSSGEIVTGVRFIAVNDRYNLLLQLDVHATKFNSRTGKLVPHTSYWYSTRFGTGSRENRKYLHPTNSGNVTFDINKTNQREDISSLYTAFQPIRISSEDGRYHTLPFIDIQPVFTHPPAILGGLGLHIKETANFGSTLILKIRNYNVWHLSLNEWEPLDYSEIFP